MSVEHKQTPQNLQWLLQWQNRDIPNTKLLALLDWMSTNVKDFPLASIFQLDAWQGVGHKLFEAASIGDADASRHLPTWGIITATLKEIHRLTFSAALRSCLPQTAGPFAQCLPCIRGECGADGCFTTWTSLSSNDSSPLAPHNHKLKRLLFYHPLAP